MSEETYEIEMTANAHGIAAGTRMRVSELRLIRWCDIQNVAKRVGKAAKSSPTQESFEKKREEELAEDKRVRDAGEGRE